jgi:hypothetical protein
MAGEIYLDKYETIRLLGEGGMGRVFLAQQLDLQRQVVVKVMHDQGSGLWPGQAQEAVFPGSPGQRH